MLGTFEEVLSRPIVSKILRFQGEKEVVSDSLVAGFRAIGFGDKSSSIMACLVAKRSADADFIADETGLPKSAVRKRLMELTRRRLVVRTENEFSLSPRFASIATSKMKNFVEVFESRLTKSVSLSMLDIEKKVKDIFKANGYSVVTREVSRYGFTQERYAPIETSLSSVVEERFRLGVKIFSSEECESLAKLGKMDARALVRDLFDTLSHVRCLGIFFFFESSSSDRRAYLRLNSTLKLYHRRLAHDISVFLFEPGSDMEELISSSLQSIENQAAAVQSRLSDIDDLTSRAKDLTVQSTILISQLESLISGQFMPFRHKTVKKEAPIFDSVKKVVDREVRNLEIFERKYNEERNQLQSIVDSFDRRMSIPPLRTLDGYHKTFEMLNSKFEPIKHELQFLYDLILVPYVRGRGLESINPFILTEPNIVENFTVNQEQAKKEVSDFFLNLHENSRGMLFLAGKAGSGKTHLLQQVISPNAIEEKIWPVYVDCPLRYDLIAGLHDEILKLDKLPKSLTRYLGALRKRRISTAEDFASFVRKIHGLVESANYEGILFILDELENSLPYMYSVDFEGRRVERESPLALAQLKKLLSSDYGYKTGFVVSFRSHILPEVKKSLKIKQFNRYTLSPAKFEMRHFQELIDERYRLWKCRRIRFSDAAVQRVVELTDSNTRHAIQYFRALYDNASRKNRRLISVRTVSGQTRIPLFSY